MTCNLKQEGFTYVEVLVASLISVFLFIAAFEGLTFCKKSALSAACLSGAESFAFDELNWYFNKPLSWFENLDSERGRGEIKEKTFTIDFSNPSASKPPLKNSKKVLANYFPAQVTENVICTTTIEYQAEEEWRGWLITVDMEWKVPGVPGYLNSHGDDGWHRLPKPLQIRRSAFARWSGRFEKPNG